ncbi:uncharacterized protein LOC128870318 [Anastrepha ludens]|uniref:uncharacterized protein LOC128870318 n=1 Tax=Anastrepha ludens TaxID=28586 RepID=UPI0023B0D801|nr:uncharacterized protein LOC128870318 [Anastrepha ludens]
MRKCKLSTMSDEEIEAYMMSVDEQLNDDGFDSDDAISDPDFQPDDFIEESTDRAILECLDEMEEANTSSASLPAFINNLETPFQLFKYFFSSEIVDLIVMETNRSAHQENVNTSFSATEADIHKFVGTLLYMSLYRYPNMES